MVGCRLLVFLTRIAIIANYEIIEIDPVSCRRQFCPTFTRTDHPGLSSYHRAGFHGVKPGPKLLLSKITAPRREQRLIKHWTRFGSTNGAYKALNVNNLHFKIRANCNAFAPEQVTSRLAVNDGPSRSVFDRKKAQKTQKNVKAALAGMALN